MIPNLIKYKNGEIYYWIAMVCQFLMTSFLITTQVIPLSKIFVVIIIIFFLAKIMLTKYSRYEFSIAIVMMGISMLAYYFQGDSKMIRIVLMFIASKDISDKRLTKFLFVAYLSLLIYVPFMCIFGGKGTLAAYGTFGIGRKAAERYMLGFDGPNRLSCVWMCFLATIYMLLKKKRIWLDLLLLSMSIGVYLLSKSRTCLVATILLIFFPYIYKYAPRFIKRLINKKFFLWTLLAIIILTFWATVSYGPLMEKLNTIFNNRMAYLSNIYMNEKVTLFGTDFDFQIYGGGMDNSYFAILFTDGLIPSLVYLVALIKYGITGTQRKDIIELSIAITFIVVAYVQEMIDVPFVNFMLFLFCVNWDDMMSKVGHANKRSSRRVYCKQNQEDMQICSS